MREVRQCSSPSLVQWSRWKKHEQKVLKEKSGGRGSSIVMVPGNVPLLTLVLIFDLIYNNNLIL